MKPLLIVPCLRHRSTPNNWADVCGFLKQPALSASGRSRNIVPFLSLGKLFAYDLMIKAAIMRHGFIYISSIGTTNGTIKRTTTGTFASRNDLRVLDMEFKNVTSAKLRATTRSHECATTCAPCSCDYTCSSSRSDLMSSDVWARVPQARMSCSTTTTTCIMSALKISEREEKEVKEKERQTLHKSSPSYLQILFFELIS